MRSSSKGRGVSSGREENPSGAGRSPRRQLWRKNRFFEFFSARPSLSLSLFLSAPDSLKFSTSGEPGQRESSWQVSASLPYVLSVGSGHDHVPPGIQKVEGVERRDRHGCSSFLSGVGVILSPAAPAAELPWSPLPSSLGAFPGLPRECGTRNVGLGKVPIFWGGGPGSRGAKQNQSFKYQNKTD